MFDARGWESLYVLATESEESRVQSREPIGLPGSGLSTLSRPIQKTTPNPFVVSHATVICFGGLDAHRA